MSAHITQNITNDEIRRAYKNHILYVDLEDSDIVCRCADDWFFFAGLTGEDYYGDLNGFLRDIPESTIIDEIYNVVQDFKVTDMENMVDNDDWSEYLYIYYTIHEAIENHLM